MAGKQAEAIAENLRSWAGTELQKTDNISPTYDESPFQKKLLDVLKQMEGEQHKTYRTFNLMGFAKLKRQRGIGNNSRMSGEQVFYTPPEIPVRDVRYPGDKMIPTLLAMLNKPLGETIVLNDAPKSHFYVACLIQREEKKPGDFISGVYLKSSIPPEAHRQYELLLNQARQSFQNMIQQNPKLLQNPEFFSFFQEKAATDAFGRYDTFLYGAGDRRHYSAIRETVVPAYYKDYLDRLKAEGNFTANEEELKKLGGKEKDDNE